ncbi:hypothetical protein BCIN_12g03170 [Botrytis cinerea B05.10]|uniref:RRM domain-containing protein n=1 Tax=Botryotinia fuckeliana (strain B05.10) TaxID=332648 RepID=A0A384JZ09_BOTFB|nr:hypothetical protein BCIN_12g03170 [Botrytis cinerea B05.10]ATZ55751.1 hypothetical protein BCIN_12g03170 [Botrytis cinerea B05.10]
MSYPQTATHAEAANTFPNRTTATMYTQQQARTTRDSQGQQATYAQASTGITQAGDGAMNAMMNQFAGLAIPGSMPNSTGPMATNQHHLGTGQVYFQVTPDGLVYAPSMFQPQSLAPQQLSENAYNMNSFPGALPYLAQASSVYPGYVPGYQQNIPYTPNARSAYYADRSDHSHSTKDVPGLENRRGSYSTTESLPGTPYYASFANRESGAHIAAIDRSPFGSTPSPQQLPVPHAQSLVKALPYPTLPIGVDIQALLKQFPPIPKAVPAVFTPTENMRTLDQSLHNPIKNNRNVYIRGLHPNTDDETLAQYAARFGKVETSKAIIDTATGACKGFGFAKYFDVRDSEMCIRGFWELGYEVGFARESFNARLKAEGDEASTNLYVSNLPKTMTESELGAIFMDYKVSSSRILRDSQNHSRGVGFARFENRDVCEEIIRKFHGQPIGEEGLLLQVRYADTPAQKDLKRITTERRQFRTNEYNVGAYGAPAADMIALASPPMPSPILPRASQIARHLPGSRSSGSWKRDGIPSPVGRVSGFKDLDRSVVKVSLTEASPKKPLTHTVLPSVTPTVSESGSADDGVTIHDSPVVVHSSSIAHSASITSPSARK